MSATMDQAARPESRPRPFGLADVARLVGQGASEDDIYRRGVDAAVRSARSAARDEAEVDVVADQARRSIAQALAECRGGA